MADFSKITDVNGNQFNIKDATARQSISELTDALSTKVSSVNATLPDTNGNVSLNAEDIPANGMGPKDVSGNPIIVTDAVAENAQDLSVDLEPIQDLHGYDHPWPGGAGKNLINPSSWADGYINENGVVVLDAGYSHNSDMIAVAEGNTYTFSGVSGTAVSNKRVHGYDSNGNWVSQLGIAPSVPAGGTPYAVSVDIPSGVAGVKLSCMTSDEYTQFELGSTATTFEPYSNICPISGRTGTEVRRKGKNLLPCPANGTQTSDGITITVTDGVYRVTGTSSGEVYFYFPCEEFVIPQGGEINSFYLFNNVDEGNLYFELINENTLVERWILTPKDRSNVTYNAMSGKTVNRIGVRVPPAFTVDATFKPAIFSKTLTNPTFEPYHAPDTAPISFGQTVYGGQVDFVSGKMRVTLANIASYNGETIGEPWWSSMDEYVSGATPTIGAQVVYTLATPIELTLTPAQLSLLEGTNILTADGTINLTYLGTMAANVQDEITEFENGLNNVIGSIAFIENQTAKTNHAVGDYIILNGIFCKVTTAIATGESIIVGTNVSYTTVADELKAILAQISA